MEETRRCTNYSNTEAVLVSAIEDTEYGEKPWTWKPGSHWGVRKGFLGSGVGIAVLKTTETRSEAQSQESCPHIYFKVWLVASALSFCPQSLSLMVRQWIQAGERNFKLSSSSLFIGTPLTQLRHIGCQQ